MNYRNFTKRCPHGFAVGLVRCTECDGHYNAGRSQRPEPKPREVRWRTQRRVHPEGAPHYGRFGQ